MQDDADEDEASKVSRHTFSCRHCECVCKSRRGLTQHMKSAHRATYERERIRIERVRIKRRHRLTVGRKAQILRIVDNNPGQSRRDIGYLCGLTFKGASSQIGRWLESRRTDVEAWGRHKSAKVIQKVEKRARFADAERELHERFIHRRRKQGLYVDGEWLKKEMKIILHVYCPRGYLTFKYSKGWLWRFCKRFRISSQAKTDMKTESDEFRISKIKAVMREYLRIQNELPATHPDWGNFLPDQVPTSIVYGRMCIFFTFTILTIFFVVFFFFFFTHTPHA
jgi:hypothetical protein